MFNVTDPMITWVTFPHHNLGLYLRIRANQIGIMHFNTNYIIKFHLNLNSMTLILLNHNFKLKQFKKLKKHVY
jgi:hypothetical protein